MTICLNLISTLFINNPTSNTIFPYPFTLIPLLLEDHPKSAETHGLFDIAVGDEFVGDFGGSHELAVTFVGNIEIDGE